MKTCSILVALLSALTCLCVIRLVSVQKDITVNIVTAEKPRHDIMARGYKL